VSSLISLHAEGKRKKRRSKKDGKIVSGTGAPVTNKKNLATSAFVSISGNMES
jgi:hypothetical protein